MIKALLFAMPESSPAFDKVAIIPNLGTVSIAGNVNPTVCDVKVADLLVVRRRLEHRVLNMLKKQSPDLVGFSCMSFHHHSAVRLAKLAAFSITTLPGRSCRWIAFDCPIVERG